MIAEAKKHSPQFQILSFVFIVLCLLGLPYFLATYNLGIEPPEYLSVATVLFLTFVVLLLIGAPITLALGAATMAAYWVEGKDFLQLVQIAYDGVDSFPIMALPSFVLAGALMEHAGVSRRLIDVAESIAGPFTGGLAISAILACLFFGAISGSGPATTAAVGMLMIPAMTKRNYDKGYAAAVTATSGGLGVIIPPSIPMVIFGVTASQSIPTMFVAGVLPGMMLAGGIMTMSFILSVKAGYKGDGERWSIKDVLQKCWKGIWAILAPVVILGGIYSGFFTPTEAAIVAIFYTIFVGLFLYRELTIKGIQKSLNTTAWITGRVLIIMFTAIAFGQLLTEHRIPDAVARGLLSVTGDNLALVWLLVIALLLFLGMFMETLATIMLITPVLMPVMTQLGVDPIHFGVVLVCCCAVGLSTPPLGENMFIASGIAGKSLEEISYKALPFIITSIGIIFLMAFIPGITLWLPELLMDYVPLGSVKP